MPRITQGGNGGLEMMTAIQRKYIETMLAMASDCLSGGIAYETYIKTISMMLRHLEELQEINDGGKP
jgi:hypothetical protein